ncbi:chemotaxis protein CheW [Pseudoroseomonas globiformis]|uniref:Chemotaxis protein CheW n=1 Tax=Teichococcus globiformis TaxID=2307229 RepID=A0ABV7G4C9_9PROT
MPSASARRVSAERAQHILEERTRRLAQRGAVSTVASRPTLLCDLGSELCGLSPAFVARVVPDGPHAALPGAPPALAGLFAAGGQGYLLIDLALALGRAEAVTGGGHVLLLRHTAPRFALRAGRVLGLVEVQPVTPGEAAPPADPLEGHATWHANLPDQPPQSLGLVDISRLLQPFLPSDQPTGA